MLFFEGCANSVPLTWGPPIATHSVNTTSINELWSLSDVYTRQSDFTPMMTADAGKIALIGSLDNKILIAGLICLDSVDGHLSWQMQDSLDEPGYFSSLTAKSGELFVGSGGVPSVKKYDFATGDLLWPQSIEGGGQPYIFIVDKEIQIPTAPFWFTALDSATGKILRTIKKDSIFISTVDDTFLRWGSEMRAINTKTGEPLWEVPLDHELSMQPVFTENTIFLRSGNGIGSVYAIERSTGKILWKTDDTFISDIAFSDKKDLVYVINQNGEGWEINGSSGEMKPIIEFSNTPFQINGPEATVGGYEIAFDNTEDILYVLLGDSTQLIAFDMK
jgi:outer membrane protein assembly factor BamB